MRNLFVMILVLSGSCRSGGEKYILEITRNQKAITGGYEDKTERNEIYAKNDSLAFAEGAACFVREQNFFDNLKEKESATIPVSFMVMDKDGADVTARLKSETYDRIMREAYMSAIQGTRYEVRSRK